MKKVLLLSVCLIVSVLLGGGKSWASVTTEKSDGNNTLTIKLEGTATEADVSAVKNAMQNCSYTKVVVTGGTITDAFVQAILYTDYACNTKINTLDLSSTSYKETALPETFFTPSSYNYRKNSLAIATLSLPSNIETIGDEALQLSAMKEIVWPKALKKIGKQAFCGSGLTELELPANVEFVGEKAFWDMKGLLKIKLNSKLRIICAGAFGCSGKLNEESATQTVLQVPASVQFIGPKAFAWRCYQDVYFMGEKAPLCPMYTFDNQVCTAFTDATDHVYMGNSGFQPSSSSSGLADDVSKGYANRENYYNGTYFTIMHYPSLSNVDEANKYRDQTRVYTTKRKDNGDFSQDKIKVGDKDITYGLANVTAGDGYVNPGYEDTYLGKQYIWPSLTQWNRAYSTASLGLQWNGTDKFPSYTDLTDEEKNILTEAGVSSLNLKPQDLYIGTRQFVLANADAQKDKYNPGNIKKDGTWWTICVPFNMTKKQVKEAFGEETKLCLFHSVTRQIEVNGKNHILITFDIDPMKNKTFDTAGNKLKYDASDGTHVAGEWKYEEIAKDVVDEPGDDDIVIWAHESYMIKPMKGENSDQDPVVTISGYNPVPGNPLPSVVRAKTVRLAQDAEADYNDCYRFVGNYESGMSMPQYSYYYGATKTDKTLKFRFFTGTTSTWKPNKSLIQASAHDGGIQDYQNFFGGSPESAAKVMQTTVFGKDDNNGDTTAIDDVQIQVGDDVLTPIFSLDGKMVSLSGDTTGLAKGVYVKAGKKFIVR